MTELAPCPSCRRHVRREESACPFCAAALPGGFATPTARPRPPRGVGRAVAFAFGVSAATVGTAGCFESTEVLPDSGAPDAGVPDAGPQDAGALDDCDAAVDECAIPIYAAAPTEDDGTRVASAGDEREPRGDA